MAHARKLNSRIKSAILKTSGDFVENLWKSFEKYSKTKQRIDITLDNYVADSAKVGSTKGEQRVLQLL